MKKIHECLTDSDKLKRLNDERNEVIRQMHVLSLRVQAIHKEMATCFDIPVGTHLETHARSAMTTTNQPHFAYLWDTNPAICVDGLLHKIDGTPGRRTSSALFELQHVFPGTEDRHRGA